MGMVYICKLPWLQRGQIHILGSGFNKCPIIFPPPLHSGTLVGVVSHWMSQLVCFCGARIFCNLENLIWRNFLDGSAFSMELRLHWKGRSGHSVYLWGQNTHNFQPHKIVSKNPEPEFQDAQLCAPAFTWQIIGWKSKWCSMYKLTSII